MTSDETRLNIEKAKAAMVLSPGAVPNGKARSFRSGERDDLRQAQRTVVVKKTLPVVGIFEDRAAAVPLDL